MLFAQITDTHIVAPGRTVFGVDTATCLRRALAHLGRARPQPEFVIITGDLTDHGDAHEYAHLVEILKDLPVPVHVIPGNHDDRAALRACRSTFPSLPENGFLQFTLEAGPLRLIALDTHAPGEAGGRLSAERLDWLEAELAAARGRPCALFMHHPPFATGIGHMDAMGLMEGGGRMAALVRGHGDVHGIFCGHLHRTIGRAWAGTRAATMPATGHQVALDLVPGTPATLIMEPPCVQWHCWQDGLVSHIDYVDGHEVVARP